MATSSPVSRLKRSSAVVAVSMLLCLMFAMLGSVDSRRSLASDACTSGIDVTQAPYAADPTGTSDSSAAFNAAIIAAAASGQTVCLPPGTYQATSDIDVNVDGVTVSAPSGATIVYDNPSGLQFFIRGNSNKVQNLQVDCANNPFSGFVINGANNQITGSSASNCGVHGFVLDGQSSTCASNTISGCTSSNNQAVGIAQNHCSGNSITGNTASSNGGEGITADNQSNGGQISGNTLTGNVVSGSGVGGIGIDYTTGLSVSGNIIQNSMDGVPGLKTQNNLGPSLGLSIEGNTFTDNAGVAIWLYCNNGECTSGSTVSGNTCSGIAMTGNQCNGMVQDDNLDNIITC